MRKITCGLRLMLALCLPVWQLGAQDPVFSQFFSAPLQLNPAFTAVSSAPRLSFNYRNQYPNWPNAYVTAAAAYEQPLPGLNSGLGLSVMSDAEGDGVYKTNYISGFFGYNVRFSRSLQARIGIEAGALQTTVDWDRLVFGDQLDPIDGPTGGGGEPNPTEETRPSSLRSTVFDVSTGLLIYSKKVYGGLSLKHLNTPDPSLLLVNDNLRSGRPLRISLHGGAELPVGSSGAGRGKTFVSPNFMFTRQGDFSQLNLGTYAGMGSVLGGLWFRHAFGNPDAVIVAAGVRQGVLRITYSYDITVSQLAGVPGGAGGAHEISVLINLADSRQFKSRKAAERWNDCLNMFR